ncbi:MAG: hypothetical protein LUC93_02335 [Planctomycetaceae bacterium]|nr:hypothetical protein [Planctomycetaceae bacterium]
MQENRKTFIVVLVLFIALAGICDAGMPFFGRNRSGEKGGLFPGDEDVENLYTTGKVVSHKPEEFQEIYGAAGNPYLQFGLINMKSCDYIYGGPKDRVSIEIATMESPTSAAGLFHHHRGKVLRGAGTSVDVGAEGVVDAARQNRNLYFYRGKMFVKILYSGKGKAPDLMPIARYIDDHLPAGSRDEKPDGFEYIEVEGINKDTIALTPGFTFNISFLPPSVWASAPGGGSVASDVFIITKYSTKEAAELHRDYTAYLKLHAEYIEEYTMGNMKLTKAVDPNQGRVVFGAYHNALIIAARPDGYDKGEVLIERVMERIDEVKNLAKESGEESGERRRWNPFRRRKAE